MSHSSVVLNSIMQATTQYGRVPQLNSSATSSVRVAKEEPLQTTASAVRDQADFSRTYLL